MAGQILGDRYEVEQQLGKKSGRWTLLARDINTTEQVVLKVVFMDDELTDTDLKLFKREVETLRLLSHPAIPRYLDYFEITLPNDGMGMALVQSYVEGTSLAACVARGRLFNEPEIRYIAHQVLDILVELHANDPPIIHRDIRPNNILLLRRPDQDKPAVHLVDFGSVKTLSQSNSAMTMVGMDGYSPPEQLGGRPLAVSDLYSLGATLVNGITGIHPAQLQVRGPVIDMSEITGISVELIDWLKRMTAPAVEKRWSSAQEALMHLTSSTFS